MTAAAFQKPVHVPLEAKDWQVNGGWKRLDDLCLGVFDCPHTTPVVTKSGPYVVRSQDIRSGVFLLSEAGHVSDATYLERIARAEPRHGDILYSREGTYFGIAAEVPPDIQVCLGQRMVLIRPDAHLLNVSFLKYWLNSPIMVRYIEGYRDGSVAERLNMPVIRGLPVPAFDYDVQVGIAEILAALDDKIELNRRMNGTLEAMARAIFKDWFVDFGPVRAKQEGRAPYLAPDIWSLFPDRLDDEGKPEGWTFSSAGELFRVSIGRTPPRKEQHHFVAAGAGNIWLSIKSMGDLQAYAFKSEEDITADAANKFRVPIAPKGAVLVSFKLTVGRVAIAAWDMHTNEAIAHLVPLPETPISNYYTYCFMKAFDYNSLGSTSSIATAVNSQTIRSIKFLVPDGRSHAAFTETVAPMFERIKVNGLEICDLAALRDLLLPKLMSGEIRVKDAETLVGQAA